MLSSVTQGNLHYDTPIYLMNIGSVYQKIGRRENANGFWRTANENLQQVLLPSATKFRQGNVFAPVCQSFRSQGVSGRHPPGADTPILYPGQTPPSFPQADTSILPRLGLGFLIMAHSDRAYVGTGLGPGPEWVTVYYVTLHTATYVGT